MTAAQIHSARFADTQDFSLAGALGDDGAERTLVDVLDRLLDRGVIVMGDLTISVADVDLLFVGLKVVLASADTMEDARETAAKRALCGGAA